MLLLASSSPRRRELLLQAGFTFETVPANVNEQCKPGESPEALVRRLARSKALAVAKSRPADTVLAADTVVALDSVVFGKPESEAQARSMLQALSGRRHKVFTGWCIANGSVLRQGTDLTGVEFWPLTDEEITAYISTGEPMDKAGAYGIQGLGALLVRCIDGDYYNVMGLPIATVARQLRHGLAF